MDITRFNFCYPLFYLENNEKDVQENLLASKFFKSFSCFFLFRVLVFWYSFMFKNRLIALILLFAGLLTSYFAIQTEETSFPYKFGLDIAGGTHLVYQADTSRVESSEISDSMSALRDVIEKRTNLFGVAEPLVQTEVGESLDGSQKEHRLIVELPGVTDISQAIAMIGQTPLLEFKLVQEVPAGADLEIEGEGGIINQEEAEPEFIFIETGISGRVIEKAQLQFDSTTGEPAVLLSFNSEGKELFAKVTSENVGELLAIFLDIKSFRLLSSAKRYEMGKHKLAVILLHKKPRL